MLIEKYINDFDVKGYRIMGNYFICIHLDECKTPRAYGYTISKYKNYIEPLEIDLNTKRQSDVYYQWTWEYLFNNLYLPLMGGDDPLIIIKK